MGQLIHFSHLHLPIPGSKKGYKKIPERKEELNSSNLRKKKKGFLITVQSL